MTDQPTDTERLTAVRALTQDYADAGYWHPSMEHHPVYALLNSLIGVVGVDGHE